MDWDQNATNPISNVEIEDEDEIYTPTLIDQDRWLLDEEGPKEIKLMQPETWADLLVNDLYLP